MKVLPVPFAIASNFGMWKSCDFSHKRKKNLYSWLSRFVLFTMYTFLASQLIEVTVQFIEHKKISETLYLLLSTSSACYKTVAFLTRKRDIISLCDVLSSDHCAPADVKEKAIQKRFDDVNRYVTVIGLSLVYGDILLMAIAPLLQTKDSGESLPYKTWLPFEIQNSFNYWFAYVHQVLGLLCSGSLATAIDNIVTGFMWQACAQFDILQHRFKTLPGLVRNIRSQVKCREADEFERILLIKYVQHHNCIHLYVKNITNTFSSVIFVQFCVSAMGITVSVYQLSMTSPHNVDFAKVLLYLLIMLIQFLMYCWFGNEVTQKSIKFTEDVYKSNWMILNLQSWKMILFLIHRSSKPIIISCYNMVVLSLDTYVHILKLSYSAFNLLRKSNGD